MFRNAFKFVCALFALVFLFGLSSVSQASSVGASAYAGPSNITLLFMTCVANTPSLSPGNFIYVTDGSFNVSGFYQTNGDVSVRSQGRNTVATGSTVGYGYNLPDGTPFDFVLTTYSIVQAPNGAATINVTVSSYFVPSYTYYSSSLNYLGGSLQLSK